MATATQMQQAAIPRTLTGRMTTARTTGFREISPQPTFEPTLEGGRSIPQRAPIVSRDTGARVIDAINPNAPSSNGNGNEPYRPLYGQDNPFEILADSIGRLFGSSNYNPPLQQQAYGYGTSGGTNFTAILIIGAIGVAIYFFFFRNR